MCFWQRCLPTRHTRAREFSSSETQLSSAFVFRAPDVPKAAFDLRTRRNQNQKNSLLLMVGNTPEPIKRQDCLVLVRKSNAAISITSTPGTCPVYMPVALGGGHFEHDRVRGALQTNALTRTSTWMQWRPLAPHKLCTRTSCCKISPQGQQIMTRALIDHKQHDDAKTRKSNSDVLAGKKTKSATPWDM